MSSAGEADTAQDTSLCDVAIVYLAAPVIVFLCCFLSPWLGIPAAIAMAASIILAFRRAAPRMEWSDLILLVMSGAWVAWAGLAPPFSPNSDWVKHYAIINQLIHSYWPPHIENGEVLRYYLGGYIAPAAAGRFLGLDVLAPATFGWFTLGVYLSLRLLLPMRGALASAIGGLVFVAFGGADIVGTMITGYERGDIGHLEWWAKWGQISSTTVSVFWTPQHAIPAWIGVGMAINYRDAIRRLSGPLMVASAMWSPFAVIGLMPFVAVALWRNWPRFSNWLCAPAAVLIAAYLAQAPAGELDASATFGFSWTREGFSWASFAMLVLFEWLAFVIVLWWAGENRRWLIVTTLALTAISLVNYGFNNDLMMRGSAAGVGALAALAAAAMTRAPMGPRIALAALIAIGAVGAYNEGKRAFDPGRAMDPRKRALSELPPHLHGQYFAHPMRWLYVGVDTGEATEAPKAGEAAPTE